MSENENTPSDTETADTTEVLDDLFLDPDEDDDAELAADDGDAVAEVVDPAAALQDAVDALQEELNATKERLVRKAADLENARRRHQREKDELTKYASEGVLKEIVPVLDDLERATDHLTQTYDGDPSVIQGIEMVARKFKQVLERRGVVAVEALGKAFDPQFHEAIQQKADDTVPNNTVVQEFQKGYVLHDRLLRPALVVVSQGGPPRVEADAAPDADESLVDPQSSGDDTASEA